MKEGIHPNYEQTTIKCACGNVIETGSTKKDIRVEVCSKCHPCLLYTSHPDYFGLIALADYFNVSLDYLVGRSDRRERNP